MFFLTCQDLSTLEHFYRTALPKSWTLFNCQHIYKIAKQKALHEIDAQSHYWHSKNAALPLKITEKMCLPLGKTPWWTHPIRQGLKVQTNKWAFIESNIKLK